MDVVKKASEYMKKESTTPLLQHVRNYNCLLIGIEESHSNVAYYGCS